MTDNLQAAKPWWFANNSPQAFRILLVGNQQLKQACALINSKIAVFAGRLDCNTYQNTCETNISLTAQQAWQLWQQLLADCQSLTCDIFFQPVQRPAIKLLICDMDSTIIQGESLDDLAELVGIGEQIAAITKSAMAGDMDFRQALDKRIALLAGVPITAFATLRQHIIYNPGAEQLIAQAKAQGIHCVLVSGGFEPIVSSVAYALGFDDFLCNRLVTNAGRLDGKIIEPIIDAQAKRDVLYRQCQALAITPEQVCAIGDGANDLLMLQAAGLGIGYKAKPLVQRTISNQIHHNGLDCALLLMVQS